MFVKIIDKEFGLKVVKEYKFNPLRKWAFDYCIPELKLAIEVEGGTFKKTYYKDKKTGIIRCHEGGRHNSGTGFLKDIEKYNSATVMGWKILRFTPDQLYTMATLEIIRKIINQNKNYENI